MVATITTTTTTTTMVVMYRALDPAVPLVETTMLALLPIQYSVNAVLDVKPIANRKIWLVDISAFRDAFASLVI
jgi:hypothetical protein